MSTGLVSSSSLRHRVERGFSLETFGATATLATLLAFAADVIIGPALVAQATRHRQRTSDVV